MKWKMIFVGIGLWMGAVCANTGWAEKKEPSQVLPPRLESKLMLFGSRVAELEQKWFKIDQRIQAINQKIFSKGKVMYSQPKGKNVLTIQHDNQMGGVFRIMEVQYELIHKGRTTAIYQAKRNAVTDPMTDKVQAFQRTMEPGDYTLRISARVQGYSPMFTYLNSYRMKLSNQMEFQIRSGQPLYIKVLFQDQGGMQVTDRLKVIFQTRR